MSVARFAFGPRLKAHRERQGITLQEIADTTKIAASLLAGLERNEVAQWPKGIYRRAFLRAYARAIDISFDPVWAEFTQLFPEDGVKSAPLPGEPVELRMTLASSAHRLPIPSLQRLIAAAIDMMTVLIVGLLLAWTAGFSAWTTVAIISLVYAGISTAIIGGSFADWFLRTLPARRLAVLRAHVGNDAPEAERVLEPKSEVESSSSRPDTAEPAAAPTAHTQRPRIFAVAPPRPALGSESREPRERRAADR
jgi:cytoskeletal protein RodZ